MSKQIFLHIGLPKTGTTFLQHEIFPKLPDTHFIKGNSNLFRQEFNVNIEGARILISSETLSGDPWSLNKKGIPVKNERGYFNCYLRNIKNLADFFPNAKIIVGFRKHNDFIASLYKQYLHGRGTMSIEKFFDPKNNRGLIMHEDLFFFGRIKAITQCFDTPPLVYTQEEVKSDLNSFMKRLCNFMSIKNFQLLLPDTPRRNEGVKYYQAKILRQLNKLDGLFAQVSFLPRWSGKKLYKMGLSPRAICQDRLAFISNKPLTLTDSQQKFVNNAYAADWQKVLAYIKDNPYA